MNSNQHNRCVGRHQLLSPQIRTYGFSNYSQRTLSCFQFQHAHNADKISQSRNSNTNTNSPFWTLFSRWRALCEEKRPAGSALVDAVPLPSATDKIVQAEEDLKRGGLAGPVSELEVSEYLSKETGRDRLVKMFTKDHMGKVSPELYMTKQVTLQAAGTCFVVMGLLASRQARADFVERNQATVFKTRFQAARRFQDQVILYSIKEGAKWALRISLFSASFMLMSQAIAVYRNKTSVWEYTIAAASMYGAMKMNMGLRGFLVSTGFGAIAGSFLGVVAFSFMKYTNETQEQRHFWQIQKELQMEKYYESKGRLVQEKPPEVQ